MTRSGRSNRPAPRDSTWDPFWYAIALWMVLLLIVGGAMLVQAGGGSAASNIVLDLLEAATVGAFAWRMRLLIRPLCDRSGLATRPALLTAVAAFAVLVASQFAYRLGATWLGFKYDSPSAGYAETGWPPWAVLIDVAVVPAILEEVAFRGVIQSGLERAMTRRDALIVQAAMFSVLHFLPAIFVSHFVMGLIFGFVRLRTKSVYPGMLLHSAWNTLVVVTS